MYAGTDMEDGFLMFHDAPAQWNEDEAQLYIKTRYPGFENRFIKPVGTTCAGTTYHNMVPGNSPENARALDSFGFADLEYAMCFNCALSWVYPIRRPPPDLQPGDTQGSAAPHCGDLGGRRGAPPTTASRRAYRGGNGCAERLPRPGALSFLSTSDLFHT